MKTDPATWLDRYGDALFRYALFKTGNTAVAEDLVQETLLAALKGHDRFQQQSSEKTWMIGILKHKVMDHFRKHAREPLPSHAEAFNDVDAMLFNENEQWRHPASSWGDPHQASEDQALITILEECIAKLPRHQQELFMLSEFRDMSNEALCKLLDISSTNNMWVQLSRIRARLRRCLDTHWFKAGENPTDAQL